MGFHQVAWRKWVKARERTSVPIYMLFVPPRLMQYWCHSFRMGQTIEIMNV